MTEPTAPASIAVDEHNQMTRREEVQWKMALIVLVLIALGGLFALGRLISDVGGRADTVVEVVCNQQNQIDRLLGLVEAGDARAEAGFALLEQALSLYVVDPAERARVLQALGEKLLGPEPGPTVTTPTPKSADIQCKP